MAADPRTLEHYRQRAPELAERYRDVRGAADRYFQTSFPTPCRIVDVGAGTGRDVERLLGLGHDAWGIEPVEEMREVARVHHPAAYSRLRPGALPDGLPAVDELGGPFDGLLCSAVLMHLAESEIPVALESMLALLRRPARLLLSIPVDRPGVDEGRRDDTGRLFSELTPASLAARCRAAGLAVVSEHENDDGMGRPGHRWGTLLLEWRASGSDL